MELDYLTQDKKTGRYKYRRRVPTHLLEVVGKREFSISLKTTDPTVAAQKYREVHKRAEAILRKAAQKDVAEVRHQSTLEVLREAKLLEPGQKELSPVDFYRDNPLFNRFTDAALELGEQGRWDEYDRLMEAQTKGLQKPRIKLSTAVEAYLAERSNRHNDKDLQKQTSLVSKHLCAVMSQIDPFVEDIDIDTAYGFRDAYRVEGKARSTIRRRIGTMKAVLTFAERRFELKAFKNPFNGLSVPSEDGDVSDKEARLPLSVDEIAKCLPHVRASNSVVSDVWTVLTFTGARPNELRLLRWDEVVLDSEVPHIVIKPNESRRVKTNASRRKVPLIGPALMVFERRRSEQADLDPTGTVFDKYVGVDGMNALSAAMVNAMRRAGVWVPHKKVPYSLRHSHVDWMRRVAPDDWVKMVHGHSRGGIAANYGGDDMLDKLRIYIEKACREAGILDAFEYPKR